MITTASRPAAASSPAVTAIWCPKLRASAITVTRWSASRSPRSRSSDSSRLPSSTYTNSKSRSGRLSVAVISASWNARMPAASLWTGST